MAGVTATYTPVDLPTDYTCPICMEDLYPAASYVPCLHKVCAGCAERCANECPTCKTASAPPRRDHAFSNLVEHQRKTAGYTCDVCSSAVAADARGSHACADALAEALFEVAAGARVSRAELRVDAQAVVRAKMDSPKMDRPAMDSMLTDFVLKRAAEGGLASSGFAVASEGVVSCATCTQAGRESSMRVCGCQQKVCSALCVAACLTCVKAERDALPEASQHEVVLPEEVAPEKRFVVAAEACSTIARVWRREQKRDEQLRLLQKARVIREDKAPGSLELADTYSDLGWPFYLQDNYSEALTWHEKARVICEVKAPGSLVLADTYSELGWLLFLQQNSSEAKTWYEKARVIREDKAPGSLELAKTYNHLGWVFRGEKNYCEALTWHEKARMIHEAKAPGSLDLANTYINLGWVFDLQDDYSEAVTWHEKARVILEDKAPGSSELARTHEALERVSRRQKECKEAETEAGTGTEAGAEAGTEAGTGESGDNTGTHQFMSWLWKQSKPHLDAYFAGNDRSS